MNGNALGRDVGETICEMSKRCTREIVHTVGTASKQARAELALFFSWTAFVAITIDEALSEKRAEQATDAMERLLAQNTPFHEIPQEEFKALLKNRYEGYLKAMDDESNEGGPAWNIAKYFTACCRRGSCAVDYDMLIPDPDDVERLGEAVNPQGLRALKALKATGQHATYPLGRGMIQTAALLSSYSARLNKGIDSFIRQYS